MITEINVTKTNYPAFDPLQNEGKRQQPNTSSTARQDIIPVTESAPDKLNQVNIDGKARQEGQQGESKPSEELLQAVKEEFDLINNVEVKFNKDDETGQTYVKIVDKESGQVIREIPPEEVRKLAEKIDEMVGLLFDKKV